MTKKAKAELKARVRKDPAGQHQKAVEAVRAMQEQMRDTAELIRCLGGVATTEAGSDNAIEAAEYLADAAISDLQRALEHLELMVEDNACVSVLQERLGLDWDTAAF